MELNENQPSFYLYLEFMVNYMTLLFKHTHNLCRYKGFLVCII